MFKKILFIIAVLVMKTGQATETIIEIPDTNPKGLVIIAPAKKYLMRERLFTNLSAQLKASGYITVRFNWTPSTLENPALEIERAQHDLDQVVRDAQSRFNISSEQTVIISKSFSTKALAPVISKARHHILLTPNCSIEQPFLSTYN